MRFAFTKHDSAIYDSVHTWIQETLGSGLQPCALLDGSMFMPSDIERWKRQSIDFQPALADTQFDAYGLQGPLIWPLTDPENSAPLQLLLRKTDGRPALSFIAARNGAEMLFQPLFWLAVANTDDEQEFHCRFADTRVLPVLLESLNPLQRDVLAREIAEWMWIARDAKLCKRAFQLPIAASSDGAPESFDVDAAQYTSLINSAEPDMIFQMIAEEMPDILPDEAPHATHERLVRLLDGARGRGIQDFPDLFQYCITGMLSADDFDRHPALQSTWERIQRDGARFGDLAMEWPDEIWEALRQFSAKNLKEKVASPTR